MLSDDVYAELRYDTNFKSVSKFGTDMVIFKASITNKSDVSLVHNAKIP